MFGNEKTIYDFRGPFRVRVEVHASFLLLAFLMVGLGVRSLEGLIWGLATFAILAGSIFLHELGHAWGGIVQSLPVRRIVLFGGGGYCERAVSGSARQQELIVAMGPIVNLTIWALSSLLSELLWNWDMERSANSPDWFYQLLWMLDVTARMNLFLALFNLMPVQPLDGGKLLHLAMLRVFDGRTAMRITGSVGLVLSVLWIPGMIYAYFTIGWVLFFIPSVRVHYDMARLKGFTHLKRRN